MAISIGMCLCDCSVDRSSLPCDQTFAAVQVNVVVEALVLCTHRFGYDSMTLDDFVEALVATL